MNPRICEVEVYEINFAKVVISV